MNDDRHAERLVAKAVVSFQRRVEQVDHRIDVTGIVEADADGLTGPLHTGEGRVDIQVPRILHVPGDDRSDAVMDVRAAIQDPHQAIEVGEYRIAIGARLAVQDLYRRPAGSDMNAPATNLQPEIFDIARQRHIFGSAGDGALQITARKDDPTVVPLGGSGIDQCVPQPIRCVGNPDPRQNVESSLANLGRVCVA